MFACVCVIDSSNQIICFSCVRACVCVIHLQKFVEAARWLRQAADEKDGEAAFYLGMMYEHGTGEFPKSPKSLKRLISCLE